ncbi:hypothetical protein TNCV_1707551 [Trichonephila clavipes]|uniref:Uncharacterized protein n=1 Tax=Trichonephila clavipes TaxID=2585209 RepID=A0A8X6RH77_TRICX|nr:hypothetical protein TNCV_1707551 [Trichonephila clavipes]
MGKHSDKFDSFCGIFLHELVFRISWVQIQVSLKTRRVEESMHFKSVKDRCPPGGVVVRRGDAGLAVVLATSRRFKITRSIAKSSRVVLKFDVDITLTHTT